MENKTSKYFKYAIGEIVLVVIGILIALAINNWNQNRINAGKEKDHLVSLKNDLENQIISLKKLDIVYNLLISKGEGILVDFNKNGSLLKIDSINSKLSFLMYSSKYPDIKTSFSELNSTGQLNLIKNKYLRTQIVKYYQNSSDYQNWVDSNTDNVVYRQIFPIIKSIIIISPDNFGFNNNKIMLEEKLKNRFESNLQDSTKEFELINAVSLRIIVAKVNKLQVEKANTEAEFLLKAIKNELDND
jgi:hypothetical protein